MNKGKEKLLNQHAIAAITFIALIPLVYYIPDWMMQLLPSNKLSNTLISLALIVPIISYIVIPATNWLTVKLAKDGFGPHR